MTSASRRPSPAAAPQGTPVFRDTAGAANVEGTIVSSPYLSNDISDASKKFAAAYKAKFNEEAELHGAKAYDGTQILLTALKTSNVATGQAPGRRDPRDQVRRACSATSPTTTPALVSSPPRSG